VWERWPGKRRGFSGRRPQHSDPGPLDEVEIEPIGWSRDYVPTMSKRLASRKRAVTVQRRLGAFGRPPRASVSCLPASRLFRRELVSLYVVEHSIGDLACNR
jgi:hypothetical protein